MSQAEVAMTVPSQEQPDVAMVVSEGGAIRGFGDLGNGARGGPDGGGHAWRVLERRGSGGEDPRGVALSPDVGGQLLSRAG